MRVLGIDPGAAIMGYGLVEAHGDGLISIAYGALKTSARSSLGERLRYLYRGIMDVIAQHRPSEVAVEEIYPTVRLRTAVLVGQARGVAILAAANHDLPVFEYAPARVKQMVTGYGGGSKHQVAEMVRLQLGMDAPPRPNDAADALAVAICHLRAVALDRLVAES